MHYLIRLIVEGPTAEDVCLSANAMLEDLYDKGDFDYYVTDMERSRWQDCWKPVKLSSKKGQLWVEEALKNQRAEFMEAIPKARYMIEHYTDEQIFNEDFDQDIDMRLSRYYFSAISGHTAFLCYLYGLDGDRIINRRDLEAYETTGTLWVVQIDCHN